MKLKELRIKLNQWGGNEGRYTGEVEYEGEKGAVKMVLDPEVSSMILATLGDGLVALTKKTANELADVMHQSVLEAKQAPTLTA